MGKIYLHFIATLGKDCMAECSVAEQRFDRDSEFEGADTFALGDGTSNPNPHECTPAQLFQDLGMINAPSHAAENGLQLGLQERLAQKARAIIASDPTYQGRRRHKQDVTKPGVSSSWRRGCGDNFMNEILRMEH